MPQSENQILIKLMTRTPYGIDTAIMSISSTLIQSCLTNVQKEFRQLEHWLNSLHPSEPSQPSALSSHSNDRLEATLRDISSSISQLTKQYEVQQLALHHIVDRLDILEGARDIQIDDNDDPWLIDSTGACLENTIIEPVESVYVIHKEENGADSHTPVMTKTPPSSPSTASLSVSSIPVVELVEEVQEVVQKVEPLNEVEPVCKVEPVREVKADTKVIEKEEVVEEEVEEEEQEQEQEQEEEEEVEEEEEGVELEEITYKETVYYKDGEGFIYGIDEDSQPTDQPIGVWKEKSQSVAFYRLK
jgi:hypothetical protein